MADDQDAADSVYDFLYVDHDRIGLLLSQTSNDGILTEIVRQSEASKGSDWGTDIKVVKVSSKNEGKKSLEQRFNTRWLLPLIFLDRMSERFCEPEEANIGSLTQAKGILSLINTEMLQALYGTSALQQVALKRGRDAAKEKKETFDVDTARIEMEAVTRMPPQVQMHLFRGENHRLWSTLIPSALVTPASELGVKHGNIVGGEWNVIGIVDAPPFDPAGSEETQQRLLARFEGQAFLQEAVQITQALRNSYGRPADSLGITALIIFREIK